MGGGQPISVKQEYVGTAELSSGVKATKVKQHNWFIWFHHENKNTQGQLVNPYIKKEKYTVFGF